MKEYLIVGIDPGTTVGLAFVDLRGNVINVESGKNLSFSEIMYEIQDHGEPVIVATDKAQPPEMVKRIAGLTNARLYSPPEDLSHQEKLELVKKYSLKNQHEKDALAAALKAYNVYSGKIRSMLKKLDFKKAWLGLRENEEEQEEQKQEPEKVVIVQKQADTEKINKLKSRIKVLESKVENLQNIVDQQRKRIRKLESMPKTADPLLEKKLEETEEDLAAEKRRVSELLKAIREGTLESAEISRTRIVRTKELLKGKVLTEDKEVFEYYKKHSRACQLVRIIAQDDERVYYTVIESYEPASPDLLERIVKEYKRRRERVFK